jgi:hypothetical protein
MFNFKRESLKTYNKATIACSASASSGGSGITEYIIELDKPLGGIVIIDFNANSISDKLEIIHNSVKKATSGMTVPNEGPFDNLYGNFTIPTESETISIDQFIGTNKGVFSTRDSIFLSETGITDVARSKQQLIWFVYTAADYNVANTVIVRVTGPAGTGWDLMRLCTNQTPIPPTYYSYNFSTATNNNPTTACGFGFGLDLYSADAILDVSSVLYTDVLLTNVFVGNNLYHSLMTGGANKYVRIDTVGVVIIIGDC